MCIFQIKHSDNKLLFLFYRFVVAIEGGDVKTNKTLVYNPLRDGLVLFAGLNSGVTYTVSVTCFLQTFPCLGEPYVFYASTLSCVGKLRQ